MDVTIRLSVKSDSQFKNGLAYMLHQLRTLGCNDPGIKQVSDCVYTFNIPYSEEIIDLLNEYGVTEEIQ